MASASLVAIPAIAVPDTASAARFGTRTLHRGMHGSDVKTAQVLLRRTGGRLTTDGAFGPATQRAVRDFERETGLDGDGRLQPPEAPRLRETADTAVAQRRAADTRQSVGGADPTADVPVPDTSNTGGDAYGDVGGAIPSEPVAPVPGAVGVINPDGTASPPESAPDVVKQIFAAGNRIASRPYRYGGGHARWRDSGYDCSGSVSYALHGAGLLEQSMPSGGFESWGLAGRGTWVTVYAKGSHMYMVVAGLRFDTSGASPSRWQADMRSSRGYTIRHPPGL